MRRKHVIVLLLAAATLLAFGRSLSNQFVTFDDQPLIYANPHLNPPDAAGLEWHWTHAHWFMYVPMVYTVWWCVAHIDGAGDPTYFHAANLFVHFLSGWFCYLILRRLVKSDWAAAAGAILFLVHPLQTEAVAWATGMKDVLSGCLALATIWAYLRFAGSRKPKFYFLASVLYLLALLAKPSTVMVPFICMAIEIMLLQVSWRRAVVWLVPWLLPAIAISIIAADVQPTTIYAGPIWERPFFAVRAVDFYGAKLFTPVRLGIDYGMTPVLMQRVIEAHYFAILGLLAFLIIAIVFACRAMRAIEVATAIFVLALLPVLGFRAFRFQEYSTVADRYAYLAMLGPALGLAMILVYLWCGRRGAAIIAAILIAFAIRSAVQTGVWRESEALYQNAIAVNPRSILAHNNLGVVYADRGNVAGAIEQYLRVIRLDPANAPACRYIADAEAAKLQANPNDDEAKQILRQMRARLTSQPTTRPGGS
jgi:hypothetical protein